MHFHYHILTHVPSFNSASPLLFLQIAQSYRVIKLMPLTLPQNKPFHKVPAQQNRSVTDSPKHYRTARLSFRAYCSTELFCAAPLKALLHSTINVLYCNLPCRTVLCTPPKTILHGRIAVLYCNRLAEPFCVATPKTGPHGTISVLYCKGIRQILSMNAKHAP